MVAEAGRWRVLQLARADPRHDYFARHGMLHVQLWHSRAAISILTPSRLTGGNFEVAWLAAPAPRQLATRSWDAVARAVAVRVPGPARL